MAEAQVIATATVREEDVGLRLDGFAQQAFDLFPSRASARKATKRGEVLLDGEIAGPARFVAAGQRVSVTEPRGTLPQVFQVDLDVPFEDGHMAVVVKPPGFPVNGARHRTLEHALPPNLAPSDAPDALRLPRPAHRLDARTGGLVAVAKSRTALMGLGRAFQERRVFKRYRAVVVGALHGEGEVDEAIDGRPSRSRYRVIRQDRALRGGWITTVDLFPITGRTHQLRRHMAALGHPILGDGTYGQQGLILRSKGLFLWAVELALPHPVDDREVRVSLEEPAKFERLRQREARRWRRWHGEGKAAEDEAGPT